ncbi:hypothetical protein [Actinoplanes sp. URMC 104]|uniref:hypothetical protein n=1 Tax=Actinoplanes sp. URMC 104 TaxID=3423409 RepID=UPI003F1CCD54
MKILGAMQNPDGSWRVEVVQRGAKVGYRLLRDGELEHEYMAIGTVEHILRHAGVDMAELELTEPWQPLAGPGAA